MSARQQIEDRAAMWLLRREDAAWNAVAQSELDAWLQESLAHKAAFWRLEAGWRQSEQVAAIAAQDVGIAQTPDPVPVAASVHNWRRWSMPLALAASLVAVLASSLWMLAIDRDEGSHSYRTAVGNVRTITEEDGSRIELNTATAVRTRVLANSREAWLDRGEAFFDIHHDEQRPFRVHAGPKTITVLGTLFSVRRDGDKVTVAVVSGRVRIDDAEARVATRRSSTIAAGDVAVSSGTSILVTASAQSRVDELTAWRRGMIVFDNTPLTQAVSELNRYSSRRIVIDDPQTGRFRIGGSFRMENSEAFLRLLNSAYGLEVDRTDGEIHISGAPSTPEP